METGLSAEVVGLSVTGGILILNHFCQTITSAAAAGVTE